jgi:acyl-CoA dehydrogenase
LDPRTQGTAGTAGFTLDHAGFARSRGLLPNVKSAAAGRLDRAQRMPPGRPGQEAASGRRCAPHPGNTRDNKKGETMSIDFEIPAEAKAIREKVRQWVHDECIPAEKRVVDKDSYKKVLAELRGKARAQGLWCPFVPKEYGGMGLGPLANALVQMELGESHLGALSMNSQGPDDATILTLLAHGTEFQKEKYLKPLLNGEKRVCYSMTEKAAGADATGMQTRAVKDGNENYILNGEKWFSSAASAADLAVVMAMTDPEAPRHQRYSTFIVELPNPGYNIKRDIPTMAAEGPLSHIMGGGHSEIEIKDLVVPAENLLGGEGQGFNMGQHRLAYGRLRHGMHNVAMAQRALDMAAAHVTKRSTFGRLLSERQGVQFMLADCASELYMARLMLLHIAYKAEKGMDMRQENSIAKVFLAHMVHKVVDTAIQLHGALGYSRDTPLAAWYTHIRSQRLVDGPDEVHRWTVGRNVIKAYQAHGTTASAAGGDLL